MQNISNSILLIYTSGNNMAKTMLRVLPFWAISRITTTKKQYLKIEETWQKRKKKRACLICSWTQKSLMAALGFQNISVIVFLRRRYSITELSGYLYPCFTLLNYPPQLARATLFSAEFLAYTRPGIDTQIGIVIFGQVRMDIVRLSLSFFLCARVCIVSL